MAFGDESDAARPLAGGNWFVGAWPPALVACEVSKWSEQALRQGGWRCSAAEDLHATLAFLGPLDVERARELSQALRAELRGLRPVRLRLGALEGFPAECSAKRVAYLALVDEEQGAWWSDAVGRTARACLRAGLARPPVGTPHLTVARPKSGPAPLPSARAPGWEFQVESLHLACRRDGPGIGRYMSFARISLG